MSGQLWVGCVNDRHRLGPQGELVPYLLVFYLVASQGFETFGIWGPFIRSVLFQTILCLAPPGWLRTGTPTQPGSVRWGNSPFSHPQASCKHPMSDRLHAAPYTAQSWGSVLATTP